MNDIRWINSHIVDLRKTPWDKEASKPEKGEYVFTGPKVYYKQRGKEEDFKVGFFLRYAPPYRELTMMEAMMGITPVRYADNLYFPEGVRPNAEGYYQVGDVILAKENKVDYLKRRAHSVKMGEAGTSVAKEKFKSDVKAAGAQEGCNVEVFDL
jgi:hypothetical protein